MVTLEQVRPFHRKKQKKSTTVLCAFTLTLTKLSAEDFRLATKACRGQVFCQIGIKVAKDEGCTLISIT